MRITSRGRITIPVEIRERLGWLPQTEVKLTLVGESIVVSKLSHGTSRGEGVVAHLRGRGSVRMTTDEILAVTRDANRD